MGGKARKGRTKWRPLKLDIFYRGTNEAESLQSSTSNEEEHADCQDSSGSSLQEEGEEFQQPGPEPFTTPSSAGFYVDGLWIPWPPSVDNAGYFPYPMGPPYWVPHDLPPPPPNTEEALHFYTPGPYIDEERELIIFPYYQFDPDPKPAKRRGKRSQSTIYEKQRPQDFEPAILEKETDRLLLDSSLREILDEVIGSEVSALCEEYRQPLRPEAAERISTRGATVGSFCRFLPLPADALNADRVRNKALLKRSVNSPLRPLHLSFIILKHFVCRDYESVYRKPTFRLEFGFASADSIAKWKNLVEIRTLPSLSPSTSSVFDPRKLYLHPCSLPLLQIHLGNSFIVQDFKLEFCLTANHEIDFRKCLLLSTPAPKLPKKSQGGQKREEIYEIINSPPDQPLNHAVQPNFLFYLDDVICQILNSLSKTSRVQLLRRQQFPKSDHFLNASHCFSYQNNLGSNRTLEGGPNFVNGGTLPAQNYLLLPKYAKLRRVFARLLETAYKRKKQPIYKDIVPNCAGPCEYPCPFLKGQLILDLKVLLKQGNKADNASQLARSVRRELGDLLAGRDTEHLTSGGEMPGEAGADVTTERLPEDDRLTHLDRCVLCQAISSRRGDLIQWLDGFMVEAPQARSRSTSPVKPTFGREKSLEGQKGEASTGNNISENECMDKRETNGITGVETDVKTISRFTVVRVPETELTRHDDNSFETTAHSIPNERFSSTEASPVDNDIGDDEVKNPSLEEPSSDFSGSPLICTKPASLPAVLRSPGELQARSEDRAKGSPLPYFSSSEALIRDTEMELNRLKYLEQKSLFQPQQYRLAFDFITPEECPEGDLFPHIEQVEPLTLKEVKLDKKEVSNIPEINGTSGFDCERKLIKEKMSISPLLHDDHAQGSLFHLPSKGKCPYRDLTEAPPQESLSTGQKLPPAAFHKANDRRESLDGQREDEIQVHEADSDSEPGSEDLDLLGHTSMDRHLYTNRLCLAEELADAHGGPSPPLDNQFKPLVPLDGLVNGTTSWGTAQERRSSEVATEVVEQIREPKMNGVTTMRPLQARLRLTSGTPVPPYVCCTIM